MARPSDIHLTQARLYFLPLELRTPLRFGKETLTHITCARVCVTAEDGAGRRASGWGETPLSMLWAWPSTASAIARESAMKTFCERLVRHWCTGPEPGHPIEIGVSMLDTVLPAALAEFNAERNCAEPPDLDEPMPWLAALVCASAFDIAVHDAYGNLLGQPVYSTYTAEYMNHDLGSFLEPAAEGVSFGGRFPCEFLAHSLPDTLPVWHLVGALDALDEPDLTGTEPEDGYPVTLNEWIRRDGLQCLKVKLRGTDAAWDYARLCQVATIGRAQGVRFLSPDFNCTVLDPAYVTGILDHLQKDKPEVYEMLLYVEQPFPYELEEHPIDVRAISSRKPLYMDESAHDWRLIRRGRELGWTGVALKTCKTQTGALLSLCWAKAHGMGLMVQDLTNPMLAQIPHVLLAAHAETIMGVECNAMQYYPDASEQEAQIHPSLYQRRNGVIDLSSIRGAGFGYRVDEITRDLPPVAAAFDG